MRCSDREAEVQFRMVLDLEHAARSQVGLLFRVEAACGCTINCGEHFQDGRVCGDAPGESRV